MPVIIATFNVNGVNSRLASLVQWLGERQPDVACLQELKAPQDKFPLEAIEGAGYGAIWQGQSRWNGVAILARGSTPVEVTRGLSGDDEDDQARYLEADVHGIRIGCLYLPNGNPQPGPRFDYKLRWMDRLHERAAELRSVDDPVVLAGDYNVIPTDLDAYKPERWVKDALFQPEPRGAYRRLLEDGWTDAIRHLYPEEAIYTFWDYWRNAFERNAGIRIDHFLLNAAASERLRGGDVDREVRGRPRASDHAPVWIELDG